MTERYTLLSEIGRGGMGVVWKARDEETGSIVAIKLLRDIYAEDPDYIRRFEREAELAQRIDSIHVVKVLGFGLRDKVPYLALEYIEGPSLHEALTAHGAYDWPKTRTILAQLAQGLADANAAGVVHRDIKPSNILIAPDGTAKLTDFGIARGLNFSHITATSTLVGTPAYLAPEGPKDARSDLYSLGVIGYELLTGAVPFRGTTYQEVIVAHIRETPDLSVLPPDARPTIAWLLAKDPTERPQRASALLPVLYGAEQVPGAASAVAAAVGLPTQAPTPSVTRPAAAPLPSSSPTMVAPTVVMAAQTVVIPAAQVAKPPVAPPYRPAWPNPAAAPGWAPGPGPAGRNRSTVPILAALGGIGLVICLVAVVLASGIPQGASGPSQGRFADAGAVASASPSTESGSMATDLTASFAVQTQATLAPTPTPPPAGNAGPPAPVVTQAPIVTKAPVVTQAPIVTKAPVVTQAPVVTPSPTLPPTPTPTATPTVGPPSANYIRNVTVTYNGQTTYDGWVYDDYKIAYDWGYSGNLGGGDVSVWVVPDNCSPSGISYFGATGKTSTPGTNVSPGTGHNIQGLTGSTTFDIDCTVLRFGFSSFSRGDAGTNEGATWQISTHWAKSH